MQLFKSGMIMNNLIKIFLLAAVALVVPGCSDYIGGDTNVDPNRASSVTLDVLLPATIEATSNNHYLIGNMTCRFAQHLASYSVGGADAYQETGEIRMPLAWTGIYLPALSNLDLMIKQAEAQSSPYYAGIGKVLQAINLGMATDAWGDVPFSEAFQGEKDLTPTLDPQELIYISLNTLLDDAIQLLQQPTSLFKPGADDLVYAGKTASWIKAAYALKARYAIHLTGKDADKAITDALAAVPSAISVNTEDLQLVYNTPNVSPWCKNVSSLIVTGNFTVGPSEQLINLMNGTFYGVIDPRMPKMFDNQGAATYSGLFNGQGSGGNSRLGTATWYASATSPVPMVTFAEVKFIEAEARLLNSDAAGAYAAYLAGITAHFQKLGLDPAGYLANPAVGVGSANLTLQLVMKEKYIAMFLNPEVWVDVRRYQYSNTIYLGMDKPVNYNESLGGEFIRRTLYPNDEINRNSVEVSPHIQPMQTKMWWEN
jgi:hypothetical protein